MRKSNAPSNTKRVKSSTAPAAKSGRAPSTPNPASLVPRYRPIAKYGFPKTITMRLRYVQRVALTCSLGVINKYSFSCNSLYDPDISGGGHQPLYFDQIMALYDHYTVVSSTIKVTACAAGATTVPTIIGVMVDDDASTAPVTNFSTMMEQSNVTKRITTGSNTNSYTFNRKWSANEMFKTVDPLSNSLLQGSASGSPVEQSSYTLFIQSIDETSTSQVNFVCEIEYLAVFAELKDLGGS